MMNSVPSRCMKITKTMMPPRSLKKAGAPDTGAGVVLAVGLLEVVAVCFCLRLVVEIVVVASGVVEIEIGSSSSSAAWTVWM